MENPEILSEPEKKSVKSLTKRKLDEFNAQQDKKGIIYISRVPPFMKPAKVRQLLGQFGEISKMHLVSEGFQKI